MRKKYSEISGTHKWVPVLPPNEVDASEVIKALGIYENRKISAATSAVADISDFLRLTLPSVQHYSPPRGLVRQFLSKFFAPEMPIGLSWGFRERVDFNASAGGRNESFVISINYGAILLAASLCCEIAAIEQEGASKSKTSSLEDLFSVMPATPKGISRYQQLLRMTMLYLFGHEFAHVVGGHCGYLDLVKKMSDADRRAIELDADHVSGYAAGAWITQNTGVATQLGWLPKATLANDTQLIELCVLASLTLFTLYQKLSDGASEKYLPPETRSCVFLSTLIHYVELGPELPIKPKVVINPICLEEVAIGRMRQKMISLLRLTSVAAAVSKVEPTAQAFAQIKDTYSNREKLKEILNRCRPSNAKEYLEHAMT
ncbi:hypothetical protein [Comamonas sp. wu1-DMT]|uniref:hypothetical protein n=1 Tax=Comamonas sp. wu1-DMT TaxID=3126390 RepID=UPI0032E3E03A